MEESKKRMTRQEYEQDIIDTYFQMAEDRKERAAQVQLCEPPIMLDPCRPAHELPDYKAGMQKVGDMLSVYGFKMTMPDTIILEYDLSDGSCKRVLLDDEQYVIPMYPRHPFLCREVNEKECEMMSFMESKIEKPDRIILEYGDDPDIAGRRITIIGDNITIDDSRIEFHTNSTPAPANVEEDSEERYYEG